MSLFVQLEKMLPLHRQNLHYHDEERIKTTDEAIKGDDACGSQER
jgi:hypothetical protein